MNLCKHYHGKETKQSDLFSVLRESHSLLIHRLKKWERHFREISLQKLLALISATEFNLWCLKNTTAKGLFFIFFSRYFTMEELRNELYGDESPGGCQVCHCMDTQIVRGGEGKSSSLTSHHQNSVGQLAYCKINFQN